MNASTAYALFDEETGAYLGYFRRVWKADAEVVCENGKPRVFQSPKDAEIAAWRALNAINQRAMLRDGETLTTARAKADAVFRRAARV
jgi:hypothetical protein